MASRMAMFYGLQAAKMNEELAPKTSLNLTLMQRPRDEDPKPREVCVRLEVEPPRAWYYRISLNFHTLVICCKLTLLLTMNLKSSMKVVTRLKTPLSSRGL